MNDDSVRGGSGAMFYGNGADNALAGAFHEVAAACGY